MEVEEPMERTLALIKPDATARGLIPDILGRIQAAGLGIVALRTLKLTQEEAGGFYAVHRERPFYESLCRYMSSGPIVAAVLEGEDAIRRWRDLMGATDPAEAAQGTIRADLGESKERNSTHGSDAPDTASFEIGYFFSGLDLVRLGTNG